MEREERKGGLLYCDADGGRVERRHTGSQQQQVHCKRLCLYGVPGRGQLQGLCRGDDLRRQCDNGGQDELSLRRYADEKSYGQHSENGGNGMSLVFNMVGGGGGGTPQLCGQVENFKVIPGTTALTAVLSWTAPSPDEDNSFVGARIVRKTGSAPTGINDGTVVYEGTALSYTDTGLTAGTTYYYRAFAYNAKKKYQTARRVVSLTATSSTFSPVLNDNTWAQIRAASDAGLAPSIWSVGDTKSIVVTSLQTYGSSMTQYLDVTLDAFILGFNHNAAREGSNRIHFHIGKQNGKQVGLSDYYQDSIIPLATIKTKLPADLTAVWKTTTKYYQQATVSSTGYQTPTFSVQQDSDTLHLMGTVECFGEQSVLFSSMGSYQRQYDYYRAGNSLVHWATDNQPTADDSFKDGTGQRRTYLRDAYGQSNRKQTCYGIGYSGEEIKAYATSTRILSAPIFYV
nr:MAG TPA: Fibronectin type 3 domain [Caudoviricetes sp.]